MSDFLWLPALLAAAWFYATSSAQVVGLTAFSSAFLFASSFTTFWLLGMRKSLGGADLVALGVYSLWPYLFAVGATMGSLVGFLGVKLGFWKLENPPPWAGLVAVFSLAALALFLL